MWSGMDKVIKFSTTPYKSIIWNKLFDLTIKKTYKDLIAENFNWNFIKEIHIIGVDVNCNDTKLTNTIPQKHWGIYHNDRKNWMLVIDAKLEFIHDILSQLGSKLSILDIRFTDIEQIDLSNIKSIRRLNLSNNCNIYNAISLENQSVLSELILSNTKFISIPDLKVFPLLRTLYINNTNISELIVTDKMSNIKYLNFSGTAIDSCDYICKMPSLGHLNINKSNVSSLPDLNNIRGLEMINCAHTKIKRLPSIDKLTELYTLNISYTDIIDLESCVFPSNIRNLNLSGLMINTIPPSIASLSDLRKLVLFDLNLASIPSDILKLNLEFNTKNNGFGICLNNTTINNVDINLFEQPRAIIEEWFRHNRDGDDERQGSMPLNEAKVIFLGDGGSGKTLTIQRLLLDGAQPSEFDGSATPGISINKRYYNIENKKVLLRIWDFGGQEIMHSMHRMFLTQRTFYVVFVNARDNTQDERARYWLHNIKSFASDSRVMIVINQIDQNPSASVNEPALRELYPNLTLITKLSATGFSLTQFVDVFQNKLLDGIGNMPYINEPFPINWRRLQVKLQNMEEYYIDANTFVRMGEECNVVVEDDVRINLLDWFSDLGISFCYRDSSALSNYMVLRPDWITNAIYIILFNGSDFAHNGLIKHEDIYKMLRIPDNERSMTKRVFTDITYSSVETEYVLGVIRRFKLSYRIDDDVEFIPMLCDRNENEIVGQFIKGRDVLEFKMEYVYLPNNVLHRLMVEMRSDLIHEFVWLSGAIFSVKAMGLSALVKTQDNFLKIYIKSENEIYPPNVYLGFIRNIIHNTNDSLGLESREILVYKKDGETEEFDYSYLIESFQFGNETVYSQKMRCNIPLIDILNQTDGGNDERRNKLVLDVIDSCASMQSNKIYWAASENERNTYIREMLRSKGYTIADQTLRGKSSSGKQAGELDLEIMDSSNRPWAIYEALNLKSFSPSQKEIWNNHLSKLLDNYNPMGLPFSFLVSYVNCKKDDFKGFWLAYSEYVAKSDINDYTIQKTINRNDTFFYVRSTECIYDRGGIPTVIYHICVWSGD